MGVDRPDVKERPDLMTTNRIVLKPSSAERNSVVALQTHKREVRHEEISAGSRDPGLVDVLSAGFPAGRTLPDSGKRRRLDGGRYPWRVSYHHRRAKRHL